MNLVPHQKKKKNFLKCKNFFLFLFLFLHLCVCAWVCVCDLFFFFLQTGGLVLDGGLSDWNITQKLVTKEVALGPPASYFDVYVRAIEGFLYFGLQLNTIDTDAASMSFHMSFGLDGMNDILPGALDNGAWSFTVSNGRNDLTPFPNLQCEYNNGALTQGQDSLAMTMVDNYGMGTFVWGHSGAFGGSQVIEVGISFDILADAFSQTYLDFSGLIEIGDRIMVSGHFLPNTTAEVGDTWKRAWVGDGDNYANSENYEAITVQGNTRFYEVS